MRTLLTHSKVFCSLFILITTLSCSSDDSDNLQNKDSEEKFLTYDQVFAIGNEISSFDEERIEKIIEETEAVLDEDKGNNTAVRSICTTETIDLNLHL